MIEKRDRCEVKLVWDDFSHPRKPFAHRSASFSPRAINIFSKTLLSVLSLEFQLILTWAGGNLDQVGGSFMARRVHCTSAALTCVSLTNRWSVRHNFWYWRSAFARSPSESNPQLDLLNRHQRTELPVLSLSRFDHLVEQFQGCYWKYSWMPLR